MSRRLLLLAIVLLFGSSWSIGSVAAQDNSWSAPLELSDAARTKSKVSWYPDLTIGPDGSIHVVWCSFPQLIRKNGETIYLDSLMYRVLRNGQWSEVNDIFSQQQTIENGIEYTVRNSIVMGLDGKLHVLVRDKVTIKQFSAPWDTAWSANAWSPLYIVGEGYYNALAMDSEGNLHALRTQTTSDDPGKPRKECSGCAHLYYTRSSNGGSLWSPRIDLSDTLEGANRPQIKIDRRNRIHVVWDDGFDWYTGRGDAKTGVYRRSDDGGNSWTLPIFFAIPNDKVQQTALALNDNGNPMVVYRSVAGGKLYMQQSTNGGTNWSPPAEIPGVVALDKSGRGLDRYSLATDSSNHVHLVMVGFKPNEDILQSVPALMHLSWNGNVWSQPEEIMRRNGYQPEWPQIEVSGGNQLHVVWFTRSVSPAQDQNVDARNYQVWYSTQKVNALATTAPPLFTPTPPPAPTSKSQPLQPTPMPTVLPAAILQAPAISQRPAWEASGLFVIGLAVVPVVGLLALLGALIRHVSTRRG